MQSSDKLAVLSCGHWGKNLAPNFAQLGALIATLDPNPETAKTHAGMYDGAAMDFDVTSAELVTDLTLKTLSTVDGTSILQGQNHGY